MTSFAKGDVVTLKSGGPKMTVSDTGDYSGMGTGPQDGVHCVWFEPGKPGKPCDEVFDAAVLEKVSDDRPSRR